MRALAPALWCAVAILVSAAHAYTVDCNPEFTDCESEMKKMTEQDIEHIKEVSNTEKSPTLFVTPTSQPPKPSTILTTTTKKTDKVEPTTIATTTEAIVMLKKLEPKGRLINLNVDELSNFASALHNTTNTKIGDLSDVNLDEEDYEPPKPQGAKEMHGKYFPNLQAPLHPLYNNNQNNHDRIKFEEAGCIVNNDFYELGYKIERNCEEVCVCESNGYFECTPRCKHPYIRTGRRLNDSECSQSYVDECCSIITCPTGGGQLPHNDNMKEIQMQHMHQLSPCVDGNKTYTIGSTWNVGCEQKCTCEPNAKVSCIPRCKPVPPSDKCIKVKDPSDDCCEIHVCDVSQDAHEELSVDTNEEVTLEPRQHTENVTRRHDTFSHDMDHKHMLYDLAELTGASTSGPLVLKDPVSSVDVLYNNSVQVNLQRPNSSANAFHLLLSDDGGKTFKNVELVYDNLILNLEPGKEYILRTVETGTNYNFTVDHSGKSKANNNTGDGCWSEGQFYAVGEEFHIGCTELCECVGNGMKECAALVCPNHVGLELVSKGCVKWAPTPPVSPPNCCPRTARCLSDGTCYYNKTAIPNWTEVPISLTGCERRCFCENGELDCQDVCSPLPKLPPPTFRCPPTHRPAPVNISEEDCCKQWGCISKGNPMLTAEVNSRPQPPPFLPTIPPEIHFPGERDQDYDDQNNVHRPEKQPQDQDSEHALPGLRIPAHYGDENRKLVVISLVADSPTSVKMLFGLPPVLVGLRGSVDLRYTDEPDIDVSLWNSQVFAPADEVLTTPRLEFRLTGLKPSTVYKIRGKLFLHNLAVEPESDVQTVRTLDLPTVPPPEEKRREIDSGLTVVDANDTTAHVSWRHFTEDELRYIDGIQVRFRPVGTPIYIMTELLHHSRSNAVLQDLKSGLRYEASLVLIPPPNTFLELHDPGHVEFNTAPYVDPYNWSVSIESLAVGSSSVELSWQGVPVPAERWVRVYRAAHTCAGARKEHDEFRLATRDVAPKLTLGGLTPDTKCRVWLELFLSNGKIKTSNVLEINTRPVDAKEEVDNMIEASSSISAAGAGAAAARGDYYGALVAVGVVAALGAITSLLLLLVVLRRHRPRSVPITPVPNAPRESSLPPYDNPAYKLELQQETMDL